MTTLARTHVASRRSVPPFDLILVVATLLVSVIGVVMVYTATRGPLLAQGEDPKSFLKKQGLFVVLGFITMAGGGHLRLPAPRAPGHGPLLADRARAGGCLRGGQQRPGRGALVQPGPAAIATLRVRRAGADPGRGVVLRAPRGGGSGLARRLPPADHGRHPDRARPAPARPGDGDDHDHRPARDAGRGRAADQDPGDAARRDRPRRARGRRGRAAAPLPDRPADDAS